MRLGDIFRIFRRRKSPKPSTSNISPDPITKFPHPANEELFAFFRSGWTLPHDDRVYQMDFFNDQDEFVDDLTEDLRKTGQVKRASVYGHVILANPHDLVFLWGQGRHGIFVKLESKHHEAVRRDGGWLDPTYPPNWVELVFERIPSKEQAQWRDVYRRWIKISYDDSVKR